MEPGLVDDDVSFMLLMVQQRRRKNEKVWQHDRIARVAFAHGWRGERPLDEWLLAALVELAQQRGI